MRKLLHPAIGLVIVLCASWIIADQVESRLDFAAVELKKDVETR